MPSYFLDALSRIDPSLWTLSNANYTIVGINEAAPTVQFSVAVGGTGNNSFTHGAYIIYDEAQGKFVSSSQSPISTYSKAQIDAMWAGYSGNSGLVNWTNVQNVPNLGPKFITPVVVAQAGITRTSAGLIAASGTGSATLAETSYNANTLSSGIIPLGTRSIILEAECLSTTPDGSTFDDTSSSRVSHIYTRASLSDSKLVLLSGRSAGSDDKTANSNVMAVPVNAVNSTFFLSKTGASMNTGWVVRMIGYY